MSRWAWALLAIGVLVPCPAHAQETITTELGAWPETVGALQSDVGAQGRTVAVCVREGRGCLPCERYTIALDAVGSQAFSVAACDAHTGTTPITLVDRASLFDHTHAVPAPRTVALRAAVLHDVESRGGASAPAGSTLGCSAIVRPFLHDLEHGADVALSPVAYELRVQHVGVDVATRGATWVLTTDTRIEASVDYDVLERSSGQRVLTGHASLACAQEVQGAGASAPAEAPSVIGAPRPDLAELRIQSNVPARVFVDQHPYGPAPLVIYVPEGSHEVRVISDGGASQERLLSVRRQTRVRVQTTFDPTVATAARTVEPAVPTPFDPWTPTDEPRATLPRCDTDDKVVAVHSTHTEGACIGLAPDAPPLFITLRAGWTLHASLLNEFGGELVLRDADTGAVITTATPAGLHGTAAIDRALPAGRYLFSVEAPDAEAGRYRLSWSVGRE